MLTQVQDFATECDVLADLLARLSPDDWNRPTAFKGWTPNEIVVHLHFWNMAVDLTQRDGEAFQRMREELRLETGQAGLREPEGRRVTARGAGLLATWQALYRDIAARWATLDAGQRVKWGGPDMSLRSAITARQMETWAHGQAIFDLMGETRRETDRIRNIVVLGVNTFGWSFRVRGEEPPEEPPRLDLRAPSGATWTYHPASQGAFLRGSAVEFCQVVAQTRNVADTSLEYVGDAAVRWMAHPQCFAGPPNPPPAPGTRGPGVRPPG